jgi:hypothetical protein
MSWPPVPIDTIQLMGAVAEPVSLQDADFLYEPKYDGVRVKTAIVPASRERGHDLVA